MKLSLRSPRRWVVSLSVAFLVAGSVGLDVSSASAHARIVSTTPSNGSQVAVAPSEIALVFSDSILEIGSAILVVDSAGRNWASGPMARNGATATQPVKAGLPAGSYRVRWRVVSADGHPLSGTFDFTTGTGPAATTAPPAPSSAAAAPAATDGPTGTTAGAPASRGGLPMPVVGALGAVAGVGIFALVVALRRNTKTTL